MYDYPHVINTRADVELLMTYLGTAWATPERLRMGLATLQGLRNSAQHYAFDRELTEGEDPDGAPPAYRVTVDEDGARRQYQLVDDPAGRVFKLGFTLAEIDDMIATVEEHL